VRGHKRVLAARDAGALERRGDREGARLEQQRDVHHHVADEVDTAGHVLALEVLHRRLGRAQQHVGKVVGHDAVELLRHRAVERAHPGLDVRDRDVRLRGGEAAGERRVRVAVDEHEIRALSLQQRAEGSQHARGLLGVGPAVDAELALGARHAELLDEHGAELVVVVLAGVDEQLLVLGPEQARHGGGLDELRPVPDDRDDAQGRRVSRRRRRAPAR
jgi:hypothetical protein